MKPLLRNTPLIVCPFPLLATRPPEVVMAEVVFVTLCWPLLGGETRRRSYSRRSVKVEANPYGVMESVP